MADLKQLAKESIVMLEKYYEKAKHLPNDNSAVWTLEGADLTTWKNTYYPQLVKSGEICDSSFFQNPVANPNYGIGADGQFTKYEYVQYLYSAYKYVLTDFSANSGLKYIKTCIDMLEPYVGLFKNHGTGTDELHSFKSADMDKWEKEYYLYFSKSGLVPDGQFFGNVNENPNYGIGADGQFAGEELCHFLYQLYKFADTVIKRNIPTWKVLFLLCKNVEFNGEKVNLTQQDIVDMKNAIRRYQNFVFAFSRGNVAIEVDEKDIDNVPLHKDSPDSYHIDIGDLPFDYGWKYVIDNSADVGIYYARFGKFQPKWLAATFSGNVYTGKMTRNFSFINLRAVDGISNDQYLEPSNIYPFPEEVAVHEFCHTLQFVLQDLFKLGTLVNPDDAFKYGYKNETPEAPIGGFYSFYQDILAGKVKDSTGKEIGVKPDMWKNTMRLYNESIETNLLCCANDITNEEPAVSDLKVWCRD